MPKKETVRLADLVRDEQLRFRLPWQADEEATVERYADAMEEYGGWGEFPPLLVVRLKEERRHAIELPGGKTQKVKYPVGALVLVGGFTRTAAAVRREITAAPAEVHVGTWELAERMAWRENSTHGRPRTRDELAVVVNRIKGTHPELSVREIAELANCGKNTVWRIGNDELKRQQESDAKAPKGPPCDSSDPGVAIQSSRRVSSTQGKVVERDLWGRPIPSAGPLQDRFAAVPAAMKATKKIRDEIVELATVKHGPEGKEKCLSPGLADLDVNEIAKQVIDLMDRVTDGLPWIVCPKFDFKAGEMHPSHHGCDLCGGRLTLTKVQADNLTPTLEKKARRWMGEREG